VWVGVGEGGEGGVAKNCVKLFQLCRVGGYGFWSMRAPLLLQAAVTYDWRLAVPNLEIRDNYFLRLKNKVEEFKYIHKEKV